ncbi:MAG: arginine--tRNA ligase, partial [Candidatus Yanofskybacteria bacterium CG10_big_fil_rev_8_21_14_0_10_37_15]
MFFLSIFKHGKTAPKSQMIKSWLKKEILNRYPDLDFDILTPPDDKMGDYSVNLAFVLARNNETKPSEEGKKIVDVFLSDKEFKNRFSRIEFVLPGFINFFLKREFLQKQLVEIYKNLDFVGKSDVGKGKTVIVEYGGTNIAKPMHVGHLRSTIIGNGLANVYELFGYKVVRWNYIGDWGTQFGKLIAAYKLWGDEKELKKRPIQTMLDLYVRFHNELKSDLELESQGRKEFKKLEDGDDDNRKLWKMFMEYSLEESDAIFRQLDIKFDITKGESGYENVINETIELIKQRGILKKSEGADIVEFGSVSAGLPSALIRKSDGTSLYITRDLASLKERIEKYGPTKILYVVANQQALHFEQLFTIWRMIGFAGSEMVHVKFGMVLGEDGKKLATREGKVIPLQEVMDKIITLALKVVQQKSPELSEKQAEEIAKAVGIGALKYNDLKQHPHTDIVFDWKAMLDISGNSGPYLQYSYARLVGILEKSEKRKEGDVSLLIEPEEQKLMKKLLEFTDAVEKCAEQNALNALALYLYELSNDANRFYESVRVLDPVRGKTPPLVASADHAFQAGRTSNGVDDENVERRNARLILIETVAAILKKG